jgi:hypothetical protein
MLLIATVATRNKIPAEFCLDVFDADAVVSQGCRVDSLTDHVSFCNCCDLQQNGTACRREIFLAAQTGIEFTHFRYREQPGSIFCVKLLCSTTVADYNKFAGEIYRDEFLGISQLLKQ